MTPFLFLFGASSFGISLNYIDGIGILGFTMIGMAAPNAPGFAGTYEASYVGGLVFFGSTDDGANFATALCFHWWIFIVQSISALIWMMVDGTSFGDLSWYRTQRGQIIRCGNAGMVEGKTFFKIRIKEIF